MEKHVLVVDDHPGIRLLLEEILKLEGYRVTIASTGKETLNILESTPVHLLIIDQHLPDMKGTQVVESLVNQMHEISVILISGLTTNLHGFKEQHTTVKAVIEKPFQIDVLLNVIKESL